MSTTQSFDDTSPYIAYKGDWNPQQSTDPFVAKYKNATFHGTTEDGDTATIVFVGTDVMVFGAKRPNHGFLSGSIDGGEKQYMNGTARDPELYQQVLFEAHNLDNATHTVIMTNEPFYDTGVGGLWFDIDFFSVNGTPIASVSGTTSTAPINSVTYTGEATFQTVPPSGIDQPHIGGSPTAVQLAVSVAPSLSGGQRPVNNQVASSNDAHQCISPTNIFPSLLGSLFLCLMLSHFRRLS
ncbi:uncharacterized protein IL334_005179 [Kwoniella shivajii]|uniref:Uncharacterized protein n=1 Tax=Kwoniella shivajii TaxID=564305 RepID=A0ABZ1D3W6_9TREE|nr:hypothetical protein IL334_005179 [Kwoniella shivajii]